MKYLMMPIGFIATTYATSYYGLMRTGILPPLAVNALFVLSILLFIGINVFPNFYGTGNMKMNILAGGSDLLILFLLTATSSAAVYAGFIFACNDRLSVFDYVIYAVIAVIILSAMFWNGIVRVYMTSVQLGIKTRVVGALLGLIPIANIICLSKIISVTQREYKAESKWLKKQKERENNRVCETKYPVILIHGVFFRDDLLLKYWGRIPEALEKNGCKVFYGNQQSALSVESSAREIAEQIKSVVEETGCEKVNLIAHSKGGLDCRYALSLLGADKYVATLTTVNTPHRGCIFVEHLFEKLSENVRNTMASAYNTALRKLGDKEPDFLTAVRDLTETSCTALNEIAPNAPGVYYQSVGSMARKAKSGRFPLNVSYPLVKKYDGGNDGLVAATSMEWGESFRLVTVKGKRGVTHADMIDLTKENIKGFDVREFYVELVGGLKNMGF